MSVKVVQFRVAVLVFLIGAVLVVWSPGMRGAESAQGYLTVRFLDVGQGDAIHVMTPDGYELLIDGGPSVGVLRPLEAGRPFFDRSIDVVLATHPDTDHVAGLVDVLERYEVDWLLGTNASSTAPAAVAFAKAARQEAARQEIVTAGQVLQLGAATTVRIFSPHGDTSHWPSNASSIIVQVVYGDTAFLLTGDAPRAIEEYLVAQYGTALRSDVLKLGHHGSDTSTSKQLLATVQPAYAVVSAGKNNRYGHPHKEVVRRVREQGAALLQTADQGSIVFYSDGQNVWVRE